MVLAYWFSVGVIMGILAHLFLRSRGEQGYNMVGEILLGSLGSLALAMTIGIGFGWGQMFARGEIRYDEVIASGLTAAIGGCIVLGFVIYKTLQSSPLRQR